MCTTDNLPRFVFPVWKRELSFAVTAVVFLGFNLLNARRGVKPTLATLGARQVVVIRSCWIFALARDKGSPPICGSIKQTNEPSPLSGRRLRPAKRHLAKRGRWTREGPGGR